MAVRSGQIVEKKKPGNTPAVVRGAVCATAAACAVFVAATVVLFLTTPALPGSASGLGGEATKVYDRKGRLLYEIADPDAGQQSWVALAELPPRLRQATIAAEDRSFYDNAGIDLLGIARAARDNLRQGRIVAGGSTITQQLVRNAFLDPGERYDASPWRKAREAFLALRLTRQWSKDEVLEAYLNTVPYGSYTRGIAAAAQVYFGKPVRDLDLAEAALLAGLPQAPSRYNPLSDLAAAQARQREVLGLMERAGYIGPEEAAAAAAEPLRFAPRAFPIEAPHFVTMVREALAAQFGAEGWGRRGWRVYTTLDLDLQHTAEAIVRRHVAALAEQEARNAALVALEPATGEVLVMVGSADYFDPEIAGAVNVALALRQPGSALKPFVYALAFEQGFTPASVLADVRTAFATADGEPYAPENYDRAWHGPVSLRAALANSYNLPAVKLLQAVGTAALVGRGQAAGLETLGQSRAGLSLALGGGEVRLLDLTAAYGTFASGGRYRPPAILQRVEDGAGRQIYVAPSAQGHTVFSPQIAHLVTSILSDNTARAPAFGEYSPLRLSRPAAAKTGTTTDWRDNWTIGYTPDLVAGVWVGNSDNRPMRRVSGISGAAPIWHDFMELALKALPAIGFAEPPGMLRAEVCPLSGGLPSEWCPERREEIFLAGTVPQETCPLHQPVQVCLLSGDLATPDCPLETVVERVYARFPPELAEWARERGVPEPPSTPCAMHGGGLAGTPAPVAAGAVSPASLLSVTLIAPDPGSTLQISPGVPRDVQRLEVAAIAGGDPARVEIYRDGVLLASIAARPYRYLWPLEPGTHTFHAVAVGKDGERVVSEMTSVKVVR